MSKKSQCPADGVGYGGADSGCEQATDYLNGEPSCCLGCPFPKCVFDELGGGIKRDKKKKRNKEIRQQFKEGQSISAIAKAVGLVYRTVQRLVKNG